MVYRPNVESTSCFVLMPFTDRHLEYFEEIVRPAARDAGLSAVKADDVYGTAPIIQDIWNQIWRARAVIADVTGRNPNVNYELGICHALGVPTVLITQDMADVPFDYRHLRCIRYDTRRVGWEQHLRGRITSTLKALPPVGEGYEDLRWPYDTHALYSKIVGSLVSAADGTPEVIRGARLVRDACATALGPHGGNISMSPSFGPTLFNRSGVVIADASATADPLRRKGVEHARRLAQEMNASVGDGSKTAILLFQELIERGYDAIGAGAVPRELIHDMDVAIDQAAAIIGSRGCAAAKTDLAFVARTAAAGNDQTSKIVADALEQSGPDGVVSLNESNDARTFVEVREGIYLAIGYLSTRFITDELRQVAKLTDSVVLITDARLGSMKQLLPLLEQVAQSSHSLLVVAADVDGEALETLVVNKERHTLRCVAVRAPFGLVQWQSVLEDVAIATGGTIISHASMSLENVKISQLGRARHVEVSANTCWILGTDADKDAVKSRAASIRRQIDLAAGEYDTERLQMRLANLVGKVSAIHVGGASSVDRSERMYEMMSALRSAREALKSGVLSGGGLECFRAGRQMPTATVGGGIVASALEVPMRQQILNAKCGERDILGQIDFSSPGHDGFDAELRAVADLQKRGVLDAAAVCLMALRLAFEHARAVLQTSVWDLTQRSVSGAGAGPLGS